VGTAEGSLTPGDQRVAKALEAKPRLLERVLTRVLLGGQAVAGPWETWDMTSTVGEKYTFWTRRVLFLDGKLITNPDYDGDVCQVMQEEDDESQNLLSTQYHVLLLRNGYTAEDLGWVNTPQEGMFMADARLREIGWLLLGDVE